MERMLESVGISQVEETLYRLLLQRRGSRASDLVEASGLSWGEVRAAIAALETAGLISRSAGKSPHLIPAAPDVAIEVLILRRQEQLERARLAANQLAKEFRRSGDRSNPADVIEVVADASALAMRFEQMQRAAREELLILDRPPYADPKLNQTEVDQLKRGVRYRVVYDPRAFEQAGQLEWLTQLLAEGEEARSHRGLPLKLTIADRRQALVPLTMTSTGVEGAVVVHSSLLLDALIFMFEMVWANATAVPAAAPVAGSQHDRSQLSPSEHDLLVLLTAGLQDKAIAHQLGLGFRTVQGRVGRLMQKLGASTRFQAGWLASEKRHLFMPTQTAASAAPSVTSRHRESTVAEA